MKSLLSVTAVASAALFAVLVSTPAGAQTYAPRYGASARAPAAAPWDAAIEWGKVVGQDPDPAVRHMLIIQAGVYD